MWMLAALLIVGIFLYTVYTMILIFALTRVKTRMATGKPFVSVVIAARNERSMIGKCLASLIAQDYPADMFEVIVVDDRSIDGTSEVLSRFQEIWGTLRVIRVEDTSEDISPKKRALSSGIGEASGEIIFQTDADCIVPPSWITGMVPGFEKGIGMVAGIAPYLAEPGILNSFVRHEYMWNAALSAASIALGYGTHASGRNLSFKREVFEHLGGYGSLKKVLSGDDTLFLQRMRRFTGYKAVTMPDPSTHVYTHTPNGIKAFLRQRVRHMSTGKYFDPFLIAIGSSFYGFQIILCIFLLISPFSSQAFLFFTGSFLLKCIMDALLASRTKKLFALEIQWKRFLVNELLLMPYMAVLPLLGLLIKVKWKEK